ncbi:MAG TPA: CDP-alcohol phosphatidyltransferase family protein, partial [Marinilabiliaceae bacterium]|nr:CDP-alcohol phosphatidyltransferase family protein [Marinilabiliaceae bacterium]
MSIIRHIPNALTSCNLLLGAVGVYLAVNGRPDLTALCILLAAVFDFFDGFAARALKAYSAIGKDLDSLADLISFGLAPAAVFSSVIQFQLTGEWRSDFFSLDKMGQVLVLLPFILTVFAALRLAKFNNDSRQTESFIGLTTTATGMFTVSLVYILYTANEEMLNGITPWMVLVLVVILSALLVSEIPMFSLKFKSFGWKGNEHRYVLLLISVAALFWLRIGALAVIVPVYVIYSILLMTRKNVEVE